MRRSRLLLLPLTLLLTVPAPAIAQIDKIKKAVVDKAARKTDQPAATGAAPKCDNSSQLITSDVVDRYLKALAARDVELQKLAREPGKVGQYYTAQLKIRELERRRQDYDLHKGPDWERHLALQKKVMQGDVAAAQEDGQMTQAMNPSQVQSPELDWETQQQGNKRVDAAMMAAGGFSQCDWTNGPGERLPRLVSVLVYDPEAKDLQGAGTPAEAAAVKPRLAELARGLGLKYVSPEDKARLKAEAEQPVSTGNAQADCMNKAQLDFMKAHKAELDAVEKSKDVNLAMKLNQQLALEMAKCSQ